jgi:hypothetical protein
MDAGEIEVADGLVLTSWRNVAINVWTGRISVELLRMLRPHIQKLRAKHPDGTATFTVLDGGGELPRLSPEALAEANSLACEFNGKNLALAYVVELNGFRGAAHRMLLSSVMTLSQPRYPYRTFDSIAAAASWISEKVVEPVRYKQTSDALVAHVAEAQRCGWA